MSIKRQLSSSEMHTTPKKSKMTSITEAITIESIESLVDGGKFSLGKEIFAQNQIQLDPINSPTKVTSTCSNGGVKIHISISDTRLSSECSQHGHGICPHAIATLLTIHEKQQLLSPILSPVLSQEFPDLVEWKDRNDRQLRLWGLHGQQRISKSNVLLLNASVVGSETLKNIVLPGFGKFAIVDDRNVTPQDLGKNFFVTLESLGTPIAKTVCESLAELNPDDVSGQYLIESPQTVIKDFGPFLDNFNFVIASNLEAETLLKLSEICWKRNINLIVCRSYGMIGYVRICVKSHEIVEGKLDQTIDDLRITNPWPELLEYALSIDLKGLSFKHHSHVPYIVLLIQFLNRFENVYNKKFPETKEEQEVFESWLKEEEKNALERKSLEKIDDQYAFASDLVSMTSEENFADAYKFIFQAWSAPEIPQQILDILKHSKLLNLNATSTDFWFLCGSLKKFINLFGVLPLAGKIPDMTSDTESYVTLQNIYRKKSRSDMNLIKKFVNDLLVEKGRHFGTISDFDIKEFCSNIYYVRYFEFKSLEDELNPNLINLETMTNELENSESNMIWYVMLRSVDVFYKQFGRYPGQGQDIKHDAGVMEEIATNFLLAHGIKKWELNLHDYAMEVSRFGGSEIHNISSLVGGVTAQELIKLCTKQRVPFVNTWIYDGIRGVAQVFDL